METERQRNSRVTKAFHGSTWSFYNNEGWQAAAHTTEKFCAEWENIERIFFFSAAAAEWCWMGGFDFSDCMYEKESWELSGGFVSFLILDDLADWNSIKQRWVARICLRHALSSSHILQIEYECYAHSINLLLLTATRSTTDERCCRRCWTPRQHITFSFSQLLSIKCRLNDSARENNALLWARENGEKRKRKLLSDEIQFPSLWWCECGTAGRVWWVVGVRGGDDKGEWDLMAKREWGKWCVRSGREECEESRWPIFLWNYRFNRCRNQDIKLINADLLGFTKKLISGISGFYLKDEIGWIEFKKYFCV